ncbi:oxidation resistance protein 1-like isoform X1 [Montipora foliosa]|uniref:oxidation resistance protein 1-like isoform X1 n=2 Tax=Montipora foliosa TaxID=591990 RepID=UPI0035F1784B
MYSLIKGYISSSNEEEEAKDSQISSKAEDKRVAFRSARSKSESSARYLSWENAAFLGGEIRKTVTKGFHWIAYPSLDYDMLSKVKRKQPAGTKEYLVDANDNLAKIALRFNTTPSELTRINKLSTRMLFPGQTLFVPDSQAEKSTTEHLPSQPIVKPPQPFNSKENHDDMGHANGDHETVKLTKDVSWEEEEEEVTEHYLKIYAKYITDGQGIANGVLLITPHSVMFKPNVSDPLVMDRGQDTYSIATLMTSVTSAAMYNDIAAMAIHDPLKPGRFYLDAATAETLSRQNSVDAETSALPSTCKSCGNFGTDLKEIPELSSSSKENIQPCAETNLTRESQLSDSANICTYSSSGNISSDSEDVRIIVHEVLNGLINQIVEYEHRYLNQKGESFKDSTRKPVLLQDRDNTRDVHSVSPTSEDSGIGCSHDEPKTENPELGGRSDHRHECLYENEAVVNQVAMSDAGVENGKEEASATSADQSLFTALSNNVKYWLGQGNYEKSDDDEDVVRIIPKPAAPIHHQPLYLCLRISKKHWCRHHSASDPLQRGGEELCHRDLKRREHWFAIPPSRTEQVYRFFQQWCPNIHNALDEDDSEDDEMSAQDSHAVEEEGLNLVETFYSNSPPTRSHPQLTKTLSEGDVARVKKGFYGFRTKPGKAAKVLTRPKPSPDFVEDTLPDMDSKSEILGEELLRKLNRCLPSRTVGHCWVLVYSTFQHGFSLKTLYRKMEFYDTPVLLVVTDDAHQIFGALCSCPLKISEGFYGTGESFLYKFENNAVEIYCWTGDNNFFIKGSKDSLAIGSGGGNFGLWLDEDLYHGSSHPCSTFSNTQLSSQEDFLCSGLEAWTFV